MKKTFKVLMAMVLMCLPMAFISCGSDDKDDDGPKTWNYKWEIKDNDISGTTEEKQARLDAESKINKLIASALKTQGGTVDESAQSVSFVNENTESQNDSRVKSAWYAAKGTTDFTTAAVDMASSAKVAIYRGGSKILEEKVK